MYGLWFVQRCESRYHPDVQFQWSCTANLLKQKGWKRRAWQNGYPGWELLPKNLIWERGIKSFCHLNMYCPVMGRAHYFLSLVCSWIWSLVHCPQAVLMCSSCLHFPALSLGGRDRVSQNTQSSTGQSNMKVLPQSPRCEWQWVEPNAVVSLGSTNCVFCMDFAQI